MQILAWERGKCTEQLEKKDKDKHVAASLPDTHMARPRDLPSLTSVPQIEGSALEPRGHRRRSENSRPFGKQCYSEHEEMVKSPSPLRHFQPHFTILYT